MYNKDKFEKINKTESELSPIEITDEMTKKGVFVAGKYGSGRTTMIENICAKIISSEEKHPVVVVDPYGDIVKTIEGCIPADRLDDVVIIDFHDKEHIVPINPLDIRSSGLSPEAAADLIIDISSSLWSSAWGPRMQTLLRMTLIAIAAHNASIGVDEPADGLSLVDVFLNGSKESHEKYISEIKDEKVKKELSKYFSSFDSVSSDMHEQMILPVLSKSYLFQENPMAGFLSAANESISFGDMISENKIILVNTGVQYFGYQISGFLGSYVVHSVLMSAETSADKPIHLFVDDFSVYSCIPWKRVLPGLHSNYNIYPVLGSKSVVSALRYLPDEAPKLISRLFGSLIVLPVEDDDAHYLAEDEFDSVSVADIRSLSACECIVKSCRSTHTCSVPNVDISDETYDEVLLRREKYSAEDSEEKNAVVYLEKIRKYGFVDKQQ